MSNEEVNNLKLEKISERVYWQSFAFFCFIDLLAFVGSGWLRYHKDVAAEFVPKTVLDFTEHVIWVYVIPITVKIIKESIPALTLLFQEIRKLKSSLSQPAAEPQETAPAVPAQPEVNSVNQMGGFQNVNNG